MINNYVILRSSPDWPNFDLEDSRTFLQGHGLPDDLIITFAARMVEVFGITFNEVRHELKQITLDSVARTRNCELAGLAQLNDPEPDDLFLFMDDDDWISPDVFEVLRSHQGPQDGYMWGSIMLGTFFVDVPTKVEEIKRGSPALQKRPLRDVLNTNNYAVTGRALTRLGPQSLFEHYRAQDALEAGQFNPLKVPKYLSCANKHPWCTVSIFNNSKALEFLSQLPALVTECAEALRCVSLDPDTLWISPYLQNLRAILARHLEAVRPARM